MICSAGLLPVGAVLRSVQRLARRSVQRLVLRLALLLVLRLALLLVLRLALLLALRHHRLPVDRSAAASATLLKSTYVFCSWMLPF